MKLYKIECDNLPWTMSRMNVCVCVSAYHRNMEYECLFHTFTSEIANVLRLLKDFIHLIN